MPDDFEIHRIEDGRVLVVLHPACRIGKSSILALLAEIGVDETDVVFLLPEDVDNFETIEGVPVLIPIDHGNCDLPELDRVGRQCGQAGGRVIILFGDTFAHEKLDPIADKYGTQCGWSAEQLSVSIDGDNLAPPHSSGGTLIERPKPSQVKC